MNGMIEKKNLNNLAEIFKQLGHPSRLCIMMNLVAHEESNVSGMTNCLSEPQSTVSQHISKLKSAGLLKGERKGTEIYYKIANEKVKELLIGIIKIMEQGEEK